MIVSKGDKVAVSKASQLPEPITKKLQELGVRNQVLHFWAHSSLTHDGMYGNSWLLFLRNQILLLSQPPLEPIQAVFTIQRDELQAILLERTILDAMRVSFQTQDGKTFGVFELPFSQQSDWTGLVNYLKSFASLLHWDPKQFQTDQSSGMPMGFPGVDLSFPTLNDTFKSFQQIREIRVDDVVIDPELHNRLKEPFAGTAAAKMVLPNLDSTSPVGIMDTPGFVTVDTSFLPPPEAPTPQPHLPEMAKAPVVPPPAPTRTPPRPAIPPKPTQPKASPPSKEEFSQKCWKCGKMNKASYRNCFACGSALRKEGKPPRVNLAIEEPQAPEGVDVNVAAGCLTQLFYAILFVIGILFLGSVFGR